MAHLFYEYRKLLIMLLVLVALVVFAPLVLVGARQRNDPGIAVLDKIELSGPTAIIDSYNSRVSTYSTNIQNNAAVVTVNSSDFNTVILSRQASIKGDVYVGPGSNLKRSIRMSYRSTITGRKGILSDYISVPIIYEPNAIPFNAPFEGDMVMKRGQQWVLDTDMHTGKLIITRKSVLTIDGNVVMFVEGDFILGSDAQLQITRDSTLDLYVTGKILISGQVNTLREQPWALHLQMLGENEVFQTTDDAAVFAVLQNPEGSVRLDADTQFFGRIKAQTLESSGAIHIDLDSGFPPVEFVRRKPRTRTTRW
jgi:hypothetical protein